MEIYNTKSKKYLKDFLKVAPLSHALWRAVEALSYDQVELKPPVLDLGCGFGEFAGVVFDKIEMGVDVNQSELDEAIKGKRYKKVKWADARKLPFKNSSYSTVVSVSVVEHIVDTQRVLAEVGRVLKKGGLFVFTVPTTKVNNNLLIPKVLKVVGLSRLGDKYLKLHALAFKHVGLKSKSWWKKQLEKSNFEIVKEEGTLSPTLLKLHELFLVAALPSQIWKLLFGKRFIVSTGLRVNLLTFIFGRFIYLDKDSDINMLFVARKK